MKFLLFIFIIFTFIKTISYGLFELKTNKNKPGAITIICITLGSCILTSIVLLIKTPH